MKFKNTGFRFMYLVFIVALTASCATASFQAYEGEELESGKISSIYYAPTMKKYSGGVETITIKTANGVKVPNTKLIELPAGKTDFTYKYRAQSTASASAWAVAMALTGILPAGIVMLIVESSHDSKNPVHTFSTELEEGKYYKIEFESPNRDKNEVKAWLVEALPNEK